MKTLLKFAYRNVKRNRRRSFLTGLSVFLGAIIVGVAQGYVNGIVELYADGFTKYQTGHVRVVTEQFVKREKFMPVNEILYDHESLKKQIAGLSEVRAVRERVRFGLLLSRGDRTIESFGMGLDLHNNELDIGNRLVKGEYPKKGEEEPGVFLGDKLAEKLGVGVGDPLLIASRTSEDGLNAIKLPVRGIFSLGMMYDRKLFVLDIKDAKRLLKIYDGTTEIFIYGKDIEDAGIIKTKIQAMDPGEGVAVQTYKDQLGDFFGLFEVVKIIYAVIEAVILFLASIVIINTMMMAIFERLREIGTMKALGMTDRELFINFTLEGAIIGVIAGISGCLVGYSLVVYWSYAGIDFSQALKGMEMPVEYIIYPQLRVADILTALGISVIVPTLAAMIPARYARRLTPAEALRK